MEDEAWKHTSRLVQEPLDWMHGDSAPWLEVTALVMHRMHVFVHKFTDIWDPSCVPLMHKSMDNVEMGVTPDRLCHENCKECKWVL